MQKIILFASLLTAVWLAGCGTPVPTLAPTATPLSSIMLPGNYRPLQLGDMVEGAKIGYQYIVPSEQQPVGVVAFSEGLVQLVSIKPELRDGLTAYLSEIAKNPKNILAFDENDPAQTEPKPMTWDATKPIEIAFIKIADGAHVWNVTETDNGEIRTAYKFVRRKDGGLRFVDAYDLSTLYSLGGVMTLNGGGAGLAFASRLALLKLFLNDPAYQRGENVIAKKLPDPTQYDPRVIKLDPQAQGLAQDLDWVLVSRAGPNGGLIAP